jgi:rubrerythrin
MDLSKYSEEDLLLSAIKSEVDSKEVYSTLADIVKNFFLKDRLKFLASEEEKHRTFLESLFMKKIPKKEIILPEKTPVPLPELKIADEDILISDVLEKAMLAEMAAHDFYIKMADRFSDEKDIHKTLQYFASMEIGHFKLLEVEKQKALDFEQYDQVWPMMHAGP